MTIRWLAVGGCAWNLVGANAANGTKEEAHQLLPKIDVMILNSLRQNARSLIDFYSKTQSGTTEIFLSDFGISLDQEHREKLAEYKKQSRSICFTSPIGEVVNTATYTPSATTRIKTVLIGIITLPWSWSWSLPSKKRPSNRAIGNNRSKICI
jgi:hypothetical protein